MSPRITAFRTAALALGFGFLYLPIALLVAYSFNASNIDVYDFTRSEVTSNIRCDMF